MSDYTPSLDEARNAWVKHRRQTASLYGRVYDDDQGYAAEFDRVVEAVRADERGKAAQIAEELEGLADSLDEHVSRDEVYGALMSLSARIGEQGS